MLEFLVGVLTGAGLLSFVLAYRDLNKRSDAGPRPDTTPRVRPAPTPVPRPVPFELIVLVDKRKELLLKAKEAAEQWNPTNPTESSPKRKTP